MRLAAEQPFALVRLAAAASVNSSASSSAHGKNPAAKMACNARTAVFIELNPTARFARNGGSGINFNVASVTTPSRPSEPTNSRCRSKPVLFLCVRPPSADDVAVGQNDFEAEDVIARDAVFQAARAAGVGGDVAADEIVRAAGGVGRIKQVSVFRRRPEIVRVMTAGWTTATKSCGVDFQNAVHAFEREHDAAAHRARSRRRSRGRAPRAVTGILFWFAKRRIVGNGFGGAGQGDGVGLMRGEPFVAGIILRAWRVQE